MHDMLEVNVELGTKLLLAQAKKHAAQAQSFAHIKINGVVVGDPVMPFDQLPVSQRCSLCQG